MERESSRCVNLRCLFGQVFFKVKLKRFLLLLLDYGGALYISSGTINLYSITSELPTVFNNNIANEDGGAIYVSRNSLQKVDLTIEFAELTDNSANRGGAIFFASNSENVNVGFSDGMLFLFDFCFWVSLL